MRISIQQKNIIYGIVLSLCTYSITMAFLPSKTNTIHKNSYKVSSTPLFGKRKLSFAEKKKKRSQKQKQALLQPPRPKDDFKVDQWEKTNVVNDGTSDVNLNAESVASKEEAEVKAQAASLIESQRKSVDMLTHVREQIEGLPISDVVSVLSDSVSDDLDNNYFVQDDFLNNIEQLKELHDESISLLRKDKLSLIQVASGEYIAPLTGGDAYVDSPRSVEFVVSLTRHLPPLINNEGKVEEEDGKDSARCSISSEFQLDETASMMNIMVYDRNARLASMKLFSGDADQQDDNMLQRKFEYINGEDASDARKVTAVYFTCDSNWDSECGGGITIRNSKTNEDVVIEAKCNRLVLFRSDLTLRKRNVWVGKDGVDFGGCLVTHLVRSQTPN